MERSKAVAQMRALCHEIGGTVTRLHPLVPRLAEPTTQGEILKALFGLTKELEVVKKHLIRLEKGDTTALL